MSDLRWKRLAGFIRKKFPEEAMPLARNLSIAKRLVDRWGYREAGTLIAGAAQLGWRDLRALNTVEGIGQRLARTAYWNRQKRAPAAESLKEILREMSR